MNRKVRPARKFLFMILFFFSAAILFNARCAGARVVEPLPEGAHRLAFDLGGPFIDLAGISFPLPMSSVTYSYGVTGQWTVFGALYTTAAVFGVIQVEAGMLVELFPADGWLPGAGIKPSAHLMSDTFEWVFRFYPVLDFQIYWKLRENQDLLYAGISNWFELNTTRALGQPQPQNWIPQFFLGYHLGVEEWYLSLELQYLAPNVSNRNLAVTYSFLPDSGAIGLHFGFGRSF